MLKKIISEVKPLHIMLSVLFILILVCLIIFKGKAVDFSDFITKTENLR